MSVLEKRVEAGAQLLDKRLGFGWEKAIDLRSLNLGDGDCCILGQTMVTTGMERMKCWVWRDPLWGVYGQWSE